MILLSLAFFLWIINFIVLSDAYLMKTFLERRVNATIFSIKCNLANASDNCI